MSELKCVLVPSSPCQKNDCALMAYVIVFLVLTWRGANGGAEEADVIYGCKGRKVLSSA
jgi:hypothetical protein